MAGFRNRRNSRKRRGVLALEWILLITIVVIGIVGVASDMLRPIRRNQELMVYFLKKQQYYGSGEPYSGDPD